MIEAKIYDLIYVSSTKFIIIRKYENNLYMSRSVFENEEWKSAFLCEDYFLGNIESFFQFYVETTENKIVNNLLHSAQ